MLGVGVQSVKLARAGDSSDHGTAAPGQRPHRARANVPCLLKRGRVTLIDLARPSRSRRIVDDVVPHGIASQGPGYVDQVRAYCRDRRRPAVAAAASDSLARCLRSVTASAGKR
jgi:hypothetical protein